MAVVAPIVGTHRMTPREAHILTVDFTADLGAAETLSLPTARLTDRMTGVVTIPVATVSGKKVQATATGLTAGKVYHFELGALGSLGSTWAGIIQITCVG